MLAAALLGGARPARALPAQPLVFPRDLGAHPGFRTEWWYVTGHAGSGGRGFGFQLTFFRSRVAAAQALASRLAARQLVFAHAAVTDLAAGRLLHDQRIARWSGEPDNPADLATASVQDTALALGDWRLRRAGDGAYHARLPASDFTLDLQLRETQPLLLQGDAGLSRKGPDPAQASYYYSLPQLAVTGALTLQGQRFALDTPGARSGVAWLDHEWSDELLHPEAVGWDWIGINLFDGSALTAFGLRRRDGSTLWAGGSFRARGGPVQPFAPESVQFAPGRRWRSPRTGADYPVAWDIATPAGRFAVQALLDDQELDSRGSTGAVYWEGLSELRDAAGAVLGRGYLEMTGYVAALRL
ncbi:lipocalin-like domain-containing protein [Xylophilus sp. ASV27]|uniref:lipocalin-like domain-containing protein n=1 Tax=Xylophilus sp. ASV27 TaxID=2795129 RepID=UPI0018EC6670|nr:lipocalin-like domain-containing protein [Xylophilus sp. ASV27]